MSAAALLLLAASAAHAAPGRCGTADALAALQGRQPPLHAGMLQPPANLVAPLAVPPPGGSSKAVYGTPYARHLETANFTINWWDDRISPATATAAAEALETAWTAFIEEQGWPAPVSSDTYYIWVLLDRSLGGTTGYTTEYFTDLYPQGYPIIYLNPDYAGDAAFWSALSAHEFMHTVQYGMREWKGTEGGVQSWYWEASATHASELAEPSWDGHQYTSAWYAEQPQLRYDSYEGYHQYGMFVLNAWLDGEGVGPGTMQAVWAAAVDRPADTWDVLIADTIGRSAGDIWAGFSGQYGSRELVESSLYTPALLSGMVTDSEGAGGTLDYLGSHYWQIEQDGILSVKSGDVLLGASGGRTGTSLEAWAGDIVTVTALADGSAYQLLLEPTGYPKDSDPSGGGDDSDPPPGDSDPVANDTDTDDGDGDGADDGEPGGGCACSSSSGRAAVGGAGLGLLVGLLAGRRRRR